MPLQRDTLAVVHERRAGVAARRQRRQGRTGTPEPVALEPSPAAPRRGGPRDRRRRYAARAVQAHPRRRPPDRGAAAHARRRIPRPLQRRPAADPRSLTRPHARWRPTSSPRRRHERAIWMTLGAGVLVWALGNAYYLGRLADLADPRFRASLTPATSASTRSRTRRACCSCARAAAGRRRVFGSMA